MMALDIHAGMLGTAELATKETESTDSDGKLQFTCEGHHRTYVGMGATGRLSAAVRRSELSVLPERGASLDVRARTSIVIGRRS